MKIEAHVIQNFAPSCLNRDDTNTPKDCEFGGVRRARISSQCIKRAVRRHHLFDERLKGQLAARSRWHRERLAEVISALGKDPSELLVAVGIFLNMLVSSKALQGDEDDGNSGVKGARKGRAVKASQAYERCDALSWLSSREMDHIVEWVAANQRDVTVARKKDQKQKLIQRFLDAHPNLPVTPDIALFGRMMANAMGMQVHAACQVAHAISTHRVDMEMDFYTAVDDLNPESETGAGMMGVTHFNSACFYRYALLDRDGLLENLQGDVDLTNDVISAFLEAWVYAIPTGKQNSMAAQNLPSFGLFVVRDGGAPCSLANAFAEPVRVIPGQDEDLIGRSITALADYWSRLQSVYGGDGIAALNLFHDGRRDRLGDLADADKGSVKAALEATMAAVRAAGGA